MLCSVDINGKLYHAQAEVLLTEDDKFEGIESIRVITSEYDGKPIPIEQCICSAYDSSECICGAWNIPLKDCYDQGGYDDI